MTAAAGNTYKVEDWLLYLKQFAEQPFQLRMIPPGATDNEKRRIVIQWMADENLLPIEVCSRSEENEICTCGHSLADEVKYVNAVKAYLNNIMEIEEFLMIANELTPFKSFVLVVQEYYNSQLPMD